MRRNITQVFLLSLFALCTSMGAQAQSFFHNKSVEERIAAFEKKKTAPSLATKVTGKAADALEVQVTKSPVLRKAAKVAEESKDVVLLDSVISDTHREYYEYNDHGWLVSAKIYDWEEGELQFDAEESFCLEYEFDDKDRVVRYSYYLYNADGSKGVETDRAIITWTGERAHTEKYYSLSDGEYDFESLTLIEEIGYDPYGNPCLSKEYEWNSETETMELVNFVELKFTGCAVVYGYDEDGEYELVFDEELMLRYCYYYVSADEYDGLNAYKIDIVEDGLTTTKTRYTIELYSGDDYDLSKLDSYWEFAEEEVITLTPSRNRYASVYYYDRGYNADDNMPSVDNGYNEGAYSTRSESEKVLDASYVFEWDEYERLVKEVYTDYEGDVETYTCSYRNDKANAITLADFETALLLHWEGMEEDDKCVMEGNFYGEVYKERDESVYGYGERINDEYDANGNVLHRTYTEVLYSDEEAGKDLNGDGVMSTEREVANYEVWITYNAVGNIASYIEYCDTRDASRAYIKYVYVDEKSDDQYLLGWREYEGASKEGSWTLTFEEISIFNENPATNPNVKPIGGWYRTYSREEQRWYGNKWEEIGGTYVEYSIDPATGEFSTTGYAPATRSDEELQPGSNRIYFTEDGWEYRGDKYAEYIYDEATGTEVLAVTAGIMEIRWEGNDNGGYGGYDPADNYEFPVGPLFSQAVSEGLGFREERIIVLEWDIELGGWRIAHGDESITVFNHYVNEQGQIVNEEKTYTFDAKTERMKETDSRISSTYSFDALNRLSTIEYDEYTVHYIYRNEECNYLLESYWIDKASGAKYNVCRYYYSDGKYIYPYTDIEEVAAEDGWELNGYTITADGEINLYNLNGQTVAHGKGVAVAPQSGLYIVDVDGKRAKVLIR